MQITNKLISITIVILLNSFCMLIHAQNYNLVIEEVSTIPDIDYPTGFTTAPKVVNNKIYIFGGHKYPRPSYYVGTDDIRVYDIINDRWSTLTVKLPYESLSNLVSSSYYNGKFYISPTWATSNSNGWGTHNRMIIVDIDMNVSYEHHKFLENEWIWLIGSCEAFGKIYFFGGHTGVDRSEIYEYDPVTDRLSVVANMITRKAQVNPVLANDGWIYYFTGDTKYRDLQFERFNPLTKQVELLNSSLPYTTRAKTIHKWYIPEENSIYFFRTGVSNPIIYKYNANEDIVSNTGLSVEGNFDSAPSIFSDDPSTIYTFKRDPENGLPLILTELTLVTPNKSPIANAGEYQTIECAGLEGTQVTLDGSGSSDPDGDELTYTWYLDEDIVSGPLDIQTATLNLQLGSYTFTLEVNDGTETSTDEVVITIEDTTPPILVAKEKYKIWPVNHKYVNLDINDMVESVEDGCSEELLFENIVITKVTSDEPEDDPSDGDGSTLEDMVISDGCTSVGLRAERLGEGNGRVYTVTLSIADASGNIGTIDFEAYVPHDVKDLAVKDETQYFVDGVCEVPLPSEQLVKTTFEKNNITVVEVVPTDYQLYQNYPNPFNPSTTIKYSIPEDNYITLGIYDALGNEVAQLENGYKSAGSYSYSFNATNLTSGIYFYTIRAGEFISTKKMLLMK